MKKMKYISIFFVAFALMLSISFLSASKDVSAAEKAPKFKTLPVSTYLSEQEKGFVYSVQLKNVKKNAKVTKVRSSNKKVLTVKYNSYLNCIYYYPKKTGKAVISCMVRQNGKKYRLKTTILVKKADPFQSISIDRENVYKVGGSENLYNLYTDKKNVRIAFQLSKGWKLKQAYYNYHTNGKISKKYKLKNNEKIKVQGDYVSVKIDATNKKGDIYRYLICIYKELK